jgi:hypothetical protein
MDIQVIKFWCGLLELKNYEIINGLVNVNGSVDISSRNFDKIPIKFGFVTGDFNCSHNILKTLEGSPVKVGRSFNCVFNNLTSLIGGPKEVGEIFYCQNNNLSTLEYGPLKIGIDLECYKNPIFEEYQKYNNYTHYMRSVKLKELIK